MGCCKSDILQYHFLGFDFEPLTFIGPTEPTFVMGTTHGNLKQNTIGLAGRPDNVSFIMHGYSPELDSESLLLIHDDQNSIRMCNGMFLIDTRL
jgi:hypothetical protein